MRTAWDLVKLTRWLAAAPKMRRAETSAVAAGEGEERARWPAASGGAVTAATGWVAAVATGGDLLFSQSSGQHWPVTTQGRDRRAEKTKERREENMSRIYFAATFAPVPPSLNNGQH